MTKLLLRAFVALSLLFATHSAAQAATYVYVGSWNVYSGPEWGKAPPAYTAQEAAALLFGGAASDYAVSLTADITGVTHTAWYDQIGIGGGVFSESYNAKAAGGLYAWGPGGFGDKGAASAYVRDNLTVGHAINYAFRISAVPEPATWAMMIIGFGAVGSMVRTSRRRNAFSGA